MHDPTTTRGNSVVRTLQVSAVTLSLLRSSPALRYRYAMSTTYGLLWGRLLATPGGYTRSPSRSSQRDGSPVPDPPGSRRSC